MESRGYIPGNRSPFYLPILLQLKSLVSGIVLNWLGWGFNHHFFSLIFSLWCSKTCPFYWRYWRPITLLPKLSSLDFPGERCWFDDTLGFSCSGSYVWGPCRWQTDAARSRACWHLVMTHLLPCDSSANPMVPFFPRVQILGSEFCNWCSPRPFMCNECLIPVWKDPLAISNTQNGMLVRETARRAAGCV